MRGRGRFLLALASSALVAAAGVHAASGAAGDFARAGGVQLDLPDGWSKVSPAREATLGDPRTLLVIGTDGVRAMQSDCQVATYRVPADGAVVVVIGWRESVGGASFLPLSGMKLRRGTFECFSGRGAVARVSRRDRDFQVNVLVGDRASESTIDDALGAARSLGLAPRT
ncbi:MAG: hypothetical protein M5U27_06120 [Gaiella sp.]|nr:hypothetical protein [Gaiella sp.]